MHRVTGSVKPPAAGDLARGCLTCSFPPLLSPHCTTAWADLCSVLAVLLHALPCCPARVRPALPCLPHPAIQSMLRSACGAFAQVMYRAVSITRCSKRAPRAPAPLRDVSWLAWVRAASSGLSSGWGRRRCAGSRVTALRASPAGGRPAPACRQPPPLAPQSIF